MDIGVQPATDVIQAYEQMKMNQAYSYLIFTLTADNKSIEIEKKGEKEETYDDFVKSLPPNEPRYCVFDYNYVFQDGRKTRKLIYIFWCPDSSKVQKKMVAASTNSNFQTKLQGFAFGMQANDFSDLEKSEIEKKIEK